VQWADVDGDGDLDLALTGSRPDGTHVVLRNMLAAEDAKRSVRVRVVDYSGRTSRPGAEVRVYDTSSRRLLGTALVDSGSGYDAQSDVPVHFGVPAGVQFVEVQVTVPAGGRRVPLHRHRVPVGTTITVRTK
jgi:hypothetical protein